MPVLWKEIWNMLIDYMQNTLKVSSRYQYNLVIQLNLNNFSFKGNEKEYIEEVDEAVHEKGFGESYDKEWALKDE